MQNYPDTNSPIIAPPVSGVHTYDHYTTAPWNAERWRNFTPRELACSHCGEFHYDARAFDALQHLRNLLNAPVVVNSAHRCITHNAHVGGAVSSAHLNIAFDIPHRGHGRKRLYDCAKRAGFCNFGFYSTFLHADLRPPKNGQYRRWIADGVDINNWV